MGKYCKRCAYILVALCILLVSFDLTLRWVSSAGWMRRWVTDKLAVSLNREVRLEKLSASLLGVKINGFALSEDGGFKNGTFFGVERLRLRVSWWHLLHKHVKVRSLAVNGVYLQVFKTPDGGLNVDSLRSSNPSQEEGSSALPVRVTADFVELQNVNVAYMDRPAVSFFVHNAAFSAKDAGVDRLFGLTLNATAEYRTQNASALFPIGLAAKAHLGEMNLERAYAQLSNLSVRYGNTTLSVTGNARDFTRPQVEVAAQVRRLSSDTFKIFAPDAPAFFIPEILVSAAAFIDLPHSRAEVSSLGLTLPGLKASASADVTYAPNTAYAARSSFTVNLADLAGLAPSLTAPYAPSGSVKGTAEVSNALLAADVTLQDVGAVAPYAGVFKKLKGDFSVKEAGDFKTGSVSGKFTAQLNEAPFLMDFRVKQMPEKIDAVLTASARRVALPPLPAAKTKEPEPEFVTDTALTPVVKTAWPLPPVTALVDIKIDSLDAPFFYGTDVAFKADLSGLTPDLKNAQGDLSLRTGNGEIRDLYRLTNASPVTKVLFLSLNVVGKVFNSLDVFSVLSSLGGSEDAAQDADANAEQVVKVVQGPDGKPMQIMVPYSSRKMDGHMKYDQFDSNIHFENGVADMKEGTFVSDTVSFTLSGQTDFKTEKINMSVQAAPGKHYADGIMPLKLNIGGTVAEPTGSMSLLGSVSSLVTQGVANNFASNAVKKGVGGIFGLFKKKETAPASEEEPLPAE